MAAWVLADAFNTGNVLTAQANEIYGIFVKPDGSTLYAYSFGSGTNTIYQYTLPTAWSLSGASYASKSFSPSSQTSAGAAFSLKQDGTKLYVAGSTNETVYQYSLSTAWDISTASYDSVSFSTGATARSVVDMFFKEDGTSFYLADKTQYEVVQFDLSTAWDLSTASDPAKAADISGQSANASGTYIKYDGTKLYVVDLITAAVYQYSLSTAWDASTSSYDSVSFATGLSQPGGIFFGNSGEKMYFGRQFTGTQIYELSLVPVISNSVATMAGTSTFTAFPSDAPAVATMAGTSTFAAVGLATTPTTGRAVDEASAGGTSASLEVSLNSAITAPASPTGNT